MKSKGQRILKTRSSDERLQIPRTWSSEDLGKEWFWSSLLEVHFNQSQWWKYTSLAHRTADWAKLARCHFHSCNVQSKSFESLYLTTDKTLSLSIKGTKQDEESRTQENTTLRKNIICCSHSFILSSWKALFVYICLLSKKHFLVNTTNFQISFDLP